MTTVAAGRGNRMSATVREELESELFGILSKNFHKNPQACRDLIKRCIEADASERQKKRKRTEDAAWKSSDMDQLIETLRSAEVSQLFVHGAGGCCKLIYSTIARNIALKSTIILPETDTSSTESADESSCPPHDND
eukprot:5541520-Prymnesium_polylepis.1